MTWIDWNRCHMIDRRYCFFWSFCQKNIPVSLLLKNSVPKFIDWSCMHTKRLNLLVVDICRISSKISKLFKSIYFGIADESLVFSFKEMQLKEEWEGCQIWLRSIYLLDWQQVILEYIWLHCVQRIKKPGGRKWRILFEWTIMFYRTANDAIQWCQARLIKEAMFQFIFTSWQGLP